MNPESENFLKEVRDFYWQYLQEYAKKENASIEHINEGIRLLERLEARRMAPCEGESLKEATTSEKNKFWDFSPDSPLGMYADYVHRRLAAIEMHKNTQHHPST